MAEERDIAGLTSLGKFGDIIPKLNEESDRGMVLVSAGFIENQLKITLLAFFRDVPSSSRLFDGPAGPLQSLSSRILACHSLGLINDMEFEDLQIIRKIRNKFAHEIQVSFEDQSIRDQCLRLYHGPSGKVTEPSGKKINFTPRLTFLAGVSVLIEQLNDRPQYAGKERRTEPNYIPEVNHRAVIFEP